MDDHVIDSLKGVRNLVNLYLTTVGYLLLLWACRTVGGTGEGLGKVSKFGLDLFAGNFSLAFGILFTVFIALLLSRMRMLRLLIAEARAETPDSQNEATRLLELFPWTASPFHRFRTGTALFMGGIAMGFLFLLRLACAHLVLSCPDGVPPVSWWAVGWCNLALFLVDAFMAWRVLADILWIRALRPSRRDSAAVSERPSAHAR